MNSIIAHRGIFNNIDIPENSIKAFQQAIKHNYSIELDIHLTKDNQLVVFHDDTLQRITNINKRIEDITIEELKQYKLLNTEERIPTLQDVLDIVEGSVLLNIEIKKTKKYKKLIPILYNELENYKGNIIIQSFDYKIINKVKKYYTSGLLLNQKYKSIRLNIIIHKLQLRYCKPHFISVDKKLLKYKYYQKITTKYPTYIWTIKNKEESKKYESYGYICNNLPY